MATHVLSVSQYIQPTMFPTFLSGYSVLDAGLSFGRRDLIYILLEGALATSSETRLRLYRLRLAYPLFTNLLRTPCEAHLPPSMIQVALLSPSPHLPTIDCAIDELPTSIKLWVKAEAHNTLVHSSRRASSCCQKSTRPAAGLFQPNKSLCTQKQQQRTRYCG